jgi:signal transduction histidine kinase
VAVVRSSLENLHAARTPAETHIYVTRAEEGLARLSTILSRMTEASRLEQGLSTATRERFDAAAVVRGCVEGYRLAYARSASDDARAPRSFELTLPPEEVPVLGAPDLLAQMLDKLVENAVDFAASGTSVRVSLIVEENKAVLRVENHGPALPDAIRESLFDSMVSLRGERSGGEPHLGLGLYIARLIAEFHGGALRAENLPGGGGAAFEAELARAV